MNSVSVGLSKYCLVLTLVVLNTVSLGLLTAYVVSNLQHSESPSQHHSNSLRQLSQSQQLRASDLNVRSPSLQNLPFATKVLKAAVQEAKASQVHTAVGFLKHHLQPDSTSKDSHDAATTATKYYRSTSKATARRKSTEKHTISVMLEKNTTITRDKSTATTATTATKHIRPTMPGAATDSKRATARPLTTVAGQKKTLRSTQLKASIPLSLSVAKQHQDLLSSMRFITLSRDKIRSKHVASVAAAFSLNASSAIVPAFDIASFTANTIDEMVKTGYLHTNMSSSFRKTPGQAAALRSHVHVWETLAASPGSDDQYFTIFEDDVQFESNFLVNMSSMLAELPSDWDFLYLFVHPQQLKNNIKSIPGKKLINRVTYTYGLGMMYLIYFVTCCLIVNA